MTNEEKSKKMERAEKKLRQAQAEYKKILREEKEKERKEKNHYKFMIGGIVHKYFPKCYGFSELELNRIIACAFSLDDVQNMIQTVISEREQSIDEAKNEDGEED